MMNEKYWKKKKKKKNRVGEKFHYSSLSVYFFTFLPFLYQTIQAVLSLGPEKNRN
jgi:hypothetical protein